LFLPAMVGALLDGLLLLVFALAALALSTFSEAAVLYGGSTATKRLTTYGRCPGGADRVSEPQSAEEIYRALQRRARRE
jgi:hypothetical protein